MISQSAVSQIGVPAEVFFYGLPLYGVGNVASLIVGYFTIVPLMYPLRITSLYAYLKMRWVPLVLISVLFWYRRWIA